MALGIAQGHRFLANSGTSVPSKTLTCRCVDDTRLCAILRTRPANIVALAPHLYTRTPA